MPAQQSASRPYLHNFPKLLRALAFTHDMVALAVCWLCAYWLRFNLTLPDEYANALVMPLGVALLVHAPVYWVMGLYRGIWRYASVQDLQRILVSVALGALIMAFVVFMGGIPGVPRSVLVMHPLLLVLFMGGSRFTYRAWKDRSLYGHVGLSGKWVLILGAGDAGEGLVRELRRSPEWQVAGLLDDNPAKQGREVHGVKIRGPVDSIAYWAERLGVEDVIVAMPGASNAMRRHAMELAIQAGLRVLTVPSLEDLLAQRVSLSQLRQVDLEDILGREPVCLDEAELQQMIEGRTVLVTGAGGSIGSELARQIARYQPERLILFELSEFALYQVEQEFLRLFPGLQVVCAVGDVKDGACLERVFGGYRPSLVFHAAAYKHVPLMEGENACQAVRNNVVGTREVALAAQRHQVEKMVVISTDKAVNPTSVMGTTKRLAECLVQYIGQHPPGAARTQFITVRFGNVLGSNGSVIPTFREQIARGGPVTVTHPDITRYFMLIPEAAQLVLQAAQMGQGGEIFVLEMGEPVRIVDLARDMIRLSGFSEDEMPIRFTGLRPGEKLFEELLADNETTLPTRHPKLRVARAGDLQDADWYQAVQEWLARLPADPAGIKAGLRRFVPEYLPPEGVSGAPLTWRAEEYQGREQQGQGRPLH